MNRKRQHSDHGVAAKKHLGQHFLKDEGICHRMVALMDLPKDHAVLEVGPGTGALTRPLVNRFGASVHVVEIDSESVAFLEDADWIGNDRIHAADLLHVHPQDLDITQPFLLAGNFPYNISSQILFRLLEWRDQVPLCVGMFQKEVADRVCAPHGSKTYGILSVLLQVYYRWNTPSPLGRRHSFRPPR